MHAMRAWRWRWPSVMASSRWTRRPPESNWGDFGPDDQLGRLNLIDKAAVLRGIASVREGRSLCLSLPLDLPGGVELNPRRHPPRIEPVQRAGRPAINLPVAEVEPRYGMVTDIVCDDSVLLHNQYSTQWDSFAHVGHYFDAYGNGVAEPMYYNGWRAGEHIIGPEDPDRRPTGAHRLGIETMAVKGIQTRGVLVDLTRGHGIERRTVGFDELNEAMVAQGATVEPGDILCLHTGFSDLLVEMQGHPDLARLNSSCAVLDGADPALREWIADSGIAALTADNYSIEGIAHDAPPGSCCRLPLHELCLFKLGIPIGELWLLGELSQALSATARTHFLLTAPPLRLPRAVGSPVTPIATI
jgi:kynurenine formamidase